MRLLEIQADLSQIFDWVLEANMTIDDPWFPFPSCRRFFVWSQGFGVRVARSVENFEHVTRLEEMALQRMSRRIMEGETGLDTGRKQGHHLRDLIISEAADWQVLTLHLAVHMQQLRSAIGSGASTAGQVCLV